MEALPSEMWRLVAHWVADGLFDLDGGGREGWRVVPGHERVPYRDVFGNHAYFSRLRWMHWLMPAIRRLLVLAQTSRAWHNGGLIQWARIAAAVNEVASTCHYYDAPFGHYCWLTLGVPRFADLGAEIANDRFSDGFYRLALLNITHGRSKSRANKSRLEVRVFAPLQREREEHYEAYRARFRVPWEQRLRKKRRVGDAAMQ